MASTNSDDIAEPIQENGSEAPLTDSGEERNGGNDMLSPHIDLKVKMATSSHQQNGLPNHVLNDGGDGKFKSPGASPTKNHHSSSSQHHKERSKDHKERPKDSKNHEHKDRSKDGKQHGSSSSSSSKHKEGSSSSSKHRDGSSSSSSKSSSSKEKEASKHSSSSHHSSSSKSKESSSSSSSSKRKEGSSSSSSSKHKEGSSSSSSHKDKSSSSSPSKSKESSSSHSKEKSSDHKHSSSSSSGDKHKSSSSDRHGDKSRDHKTSSSSKSSSSSSSDKHRSKESSSHVKKEKESSSSSVVKKEKDSSGSSAEKKEKDSSSSSSVKKERDSAGDSPVKKEKEANNLTARKQHNSKNSHGNKVDDINSMDCHPVVKEEPSSPSKSSQSSSPRKDMSLTKLPVKEVKKEIKKEPVGSDEDETPLSVRMKTKRVKAESEDDDDEPLSSRMDKVKKRKVEEKPKPQKRKYEEEEEEEEVKPPKAKKGKEEGGKAGAGRGKKEEDNQVWRWWEEEKRDDGVKWTFLEHQGPVFAPPYEPLPKDIKFYYDGKPMPLKQDTEEVTTFYAKMLDHEYTGREVFNQNFFKDWRKVMTKEEKEIITDLRKCNFTEINEYFKVKNEQRKNMSKEEKQIQKKKNEEITNQYGFCTIDGHKEKIGNFKIEPPGLFRGRGDHPKQGMLKRRVMPEDVIINCSKDSKFPKPPEGHKWKEVRHDNHVTWLSSWTENIQGSVKYVMLNAASKLKGEKDWQKYETARRLHKSVDKIRAQYREDWKSKEMRVRQRSVALYFIDKLALRAGNEKEEGETADTVGCCSLRVEHLTLHEEKDGKQHVVDFDFLGKDSIRYQNTVPVEKRVFKNLQLFMENKQKEDDIFDRLNTSVLNKHLQELMEGLTAKVFRTYNASHTLQQQLKLLTNPDDSVAAKILSYNRANRAVAVLCNHQRAVPKTFAKSMENLNNKIQAKRKEIKQVKKEIKEVKADYKATKTAKARTMYEKKKKALTRLEEQLVKLEVQATDKDENKEIALGTSKLNYLDPRISVAWCKKFEVPIEKIYNKTQRDKFRWAIDMATADFEF
ncbi:DNA topoisomerase I, mitochondrial-like [Babylonia areolata]|uniref:DNA topoisomerase I, mitochondrial-like n=1 Tax=Babylonia areolata TaxID=304850 RepID=UPI003FCF9724